MSLREFAEAVAIDIEDSPRFDAERRLMDPQDVFAICSSLVTVTPKSGNQWVVVGAFLRPRIPCVVGPSRWTV